MVGAGAPPPPASILAPRPALTLRGLLPATPYDVTVTARNARGSSAPLSVTATTSGKCNRKWGAKTKVKPEVGGEVKTKVKPGSCSVWGEGGK